MFSMPPFFKEIFKHLPSALLDVISWGEMLKEVTKLSNRILTKKGAPSGILGVENMELVEELTGAKLERSHGEKILQLYFSQIMNNSQFFLDFRLKHFSQIDNQIQWSPGGLWAQMDPPFLRGMRKIYLGYYDHDDALFLQGMLECGLVKKEWQEAKRNEVIEVFKKHFSSGREETISFDIEVFKESFTQIFKTLVKNKIQLDKNFLYLGIMLVTLYLCLDELGGEYDVSAIFKNAHPHP